MASQNLSMFATDFKNESVRGVKPVILGIHFSYLYDNPTVVGQDMECDLFYKHNSVLKHDAFVLFFSPQLNWEITQQQNVAVNPVGKNYTHIK